jgi:4-alpha-glucanotransferase
MLRRKSGILLHPTSLPGDFGIGDLGKWAHRFVEFLAGSGHRLWQILPLGPPGYGNSPYQCYSSLAGNSLLVSPELLADEGWIERAELDRAPAFPEDRVDFDAVIPFRWSLLRQSAREFFERAPAGRREEFDLFCKENGDWLEKFAEFAALKEANGGVAWTDWKKRSDPDPNEVRTQKFVQFQFNCQWKSLKRRCHESGIQIIGDVPIFVAHDSADVWANPELFDLDDAGLPRTIAGVPPDYFSATGQCWGNPLYRWNVHEETGFRWWIARIRSTLEQVDIARIDHFRGFEKYYEIPGGAQTAVVGRWLEGPGDQFFEALQQTFDKLPFIAEDLGLITPEVHALRDRWGFPGMRVLQFAFGHDSPYDLFKPYNFVPNCVVYTGTHDNDTTAGWFGSAGRGTSTQSAEQERRERESALRYMNSDGREIHWDFIRTAVSSVAETAIYPMQDVLGLGSEARMNLPASAENNWQWRMRAEQITPALSARLLGLNRTYGRVE